MSSVQDAVARTRERLARERLGIPELESKLTEMKAANRRCRILGDDELWSDEEISQVENDLDQRIEKLKAYPF